MKEQSPTLAVKKEYLKSYLYAKRELPILEEEIREFQYAKSASGQTIRPHQKNHTYRDYSHYISLLDNLLEQLQEKRIFCIQTYQEIIRCIDSLDDDTERIVLRLKYIQGKTIESIGETLHYSVRQINNIHKKALEHLIIDK